MQRREFHKGAAATALSALFNLAGCGGGGGGAGPGALTDPVGTGGATPQPGPAPDAPPARELVAMGANFSGMEWAGAELRLSPRTLPNIDYTVPRASDVAYLAANGFGRNRLPISWELLQPMLSDTQASAQVRAIVGEPGAFHAAHARYIDRVLDAHAAVGARCIIDLHNYCRYRDFRYQGDGSVIGLVRPDDALLHPYTTDRSQVFTRIFATAPGASLRAAAFADVWRRAALRWKDHPGLGGYGLMNEPHDMPPPGGVVEQPTDAGIEDLMIWPTFAQAAIDAIRSVDPATTIYVGGNAWGGAMNIGRRYNPGFPLRGDNLVYEVHSYLDAFNNGAGYDWELEVAKNYVAGFGVGPMTLATGVERMRVATDWARANGAKVALTETGMPVDDPRWQEAFERLMALTWEAGVETQSWMGGNHWPVRNAPTNHVPGWHQNRTLEPLVAGPMKAVAGVDLASLFDDGPGWTPAGPVTITVYARGHLAAPVALRVASDNGGAFSKRDLLIPAGANGQDSYTFTPEPNRVTMLRYGADAGRQTPPSRQVYSLADPVAHAATSLGEAAMAILARYGAAKWDMADAFTDFVQGRPASEGETVRAVSDSGWGSSVGNAMEMVNAMNQDAADMGPLRPPVMRASGGRKRADHAGEICTGLWCKKTVPGPSFPNPRNRVPWGLADPHFVVATVSVPGANSGVVFQASTPGMPWTSELGFTNGQPQARAIDATGAGVTLTAPARLAPGAAAVLSFASAPGAQRLRSTAIRPPAPARAWLLRRSAS